MSSRLVVRHSGCFWEESLLNVAILHLGLLSLSLHQTSVYNVFLFSLSRWGISSRNRDTMQRLTTVSNPSRWQRSSNQIPCDEWVILWSARRWRYKEICVLVSAQTHIVGRVKHVKILRNAAAYWGWYIFCHGRLFVGGLVKSGQDKALSAFIWRRGNKLLHTNSVGAREAQLKAVKILLLVVTFPN